MKIMRISVLLVFLATLLAANAHGQKKRGSTKPGVNSSTARVVSPIEKSAEEIRDKRPEISYDTLFEDSNAVQASLSSIRYTYFKMDLDYSLAEQVAIFSWKQLRLKHLEPTAALLPQDLINFVSELGVLVIKSTPAGAAIELNGTPLEEITDAVRFPSPGTYRVRLSMQGYEPVEEDCLVTKKKKTEFYKQLKPLPTKQRDHPRASRGLAGQ